MWWTRYRARERKLEDQRHNLEICLSNSQQETTDLHIQLNGQEGRMGEVFSTMARLEGAKKDLETQISNVASLLHHVRSSSAHSTSRSRPSTPNRSSRASNNHRASSFQETSAFSSKNSGGEVDFEQIKGESLTGSYADSYVLTFFSELVMFKGQIISKANFEVFIWTINGKKIFFYFCPRPLKWIKPKKEYNHYIRW